MKHRKRVLTSDSPLLARYGTINPYRNAAYELRSRLRWDMQPESWRSRRTLRAWRDRYKGQKAVILCNGPSLLKTDLGALDGVFTFGLNKINLLFDKSPLRPACIVSVNALVIEQNAPFFNQSDIPLFLDTYACGHVRPRPNVAFLHSSGQRKFARDCSMSIFQGATVTFVAMQLAFHMGFRQVGLVGCDHNFSTKGPANKTVVSGERDNDHFDPNYFAGGVKWQLPDLAESEANYAMAGEVFAAAGGRIVNCTVGGKLEIYQRMDLAEFLGIMKLTVRQAADGFDWLVLIGSLILFQTPVLLSSELSPMAVRLLRAACLAPFWIVILRHLFWSLLAKPQALRIRRPSGLLLGLLLAFVLLLMASYLRAYLSRSITASEVLRNILEWVTITLFGITLFLRTIGPDGEHRRQTLLWGIIAAIGVYVSLNVLMHFGHIAPPNKFANIYSAELGPTRMLAIVGMNYERVLFPFASGINAFGGISGMTLVAGMLLLLRSQNRTPKIIGVALSVVGLCAILLTDSRVVLASAILTIGLFWIGPRTLLRWSPLIVVITPFLPLLLLSYSQIIASLSAQGFVQYITRGAGEISSLNSRTYIWEAVLQEYSNFSPTQTVGYGMFGQATLGVYQIYSRYFTAYVNPELISLHNYSLQYLIDTGYIGLLLFSLLLGYTLNVWTRRIGSDEDLIARIIVAMIIFLLCTGTAGVELTPYSRETFAVLILSICAALPRKPAASPLPTTVAAVPIPTLAR